MSKSDTTGQASLSVKSIVCHATRTPAIAIDWLWALRWRNGLHAKTGKTKLEF